MCQSISLDIELAHFLVELWLWNWYIGSGSTPHGKTQVFILGIVQSLILRVALQNPPTAFGEWVEVTKHTAIDFLNTLVLTVIEGQPIASGHPIKGRIFLQQYAGASRVYFLPCQAVPVNAGCKAADIVEIAGLIHIAALSHDTVG